MREAPLSQLLSNSENVVKSYQIACCVASIDCQINICFFRFGKKTQKQTKSKLLNLWRQSHFVAMKEEKLCQYMLGMV